MKMEKHEFELNGVKFVATVERDEDCGPPWEECDGHGIVSDWTMRAKKPGEMILHQSRWGKRYYNFAESVKIARRDGWNAAPYTGTRGECAARAAMANFEYLRKWCDDEWHYTVVTVRRADSCACCGHSESVGMVESGYWEEAATEIAGGMV
jgi:hypothetical protein